MTKAAHSIAPASAPAPAVETEDKEMLRAAAELTRDLIAPRPAVYWADFLGSAIIGYGALALALAAPTLTLALAAALFSVLGLYRAAGFLHEITHIKRSAVPGFWLGWNLLVGIPLLIPSFMYEGVHSLHHARTRYGTAEDPEYLPLALMKPWTVPVFVLVAAFGPVALLVRFAILGPLSLFVPPLRRLVVARYSGLVINPGFQRRAPEGTFRREWLGLEIACSLWAIALLAAVATGAIAIQPALIALGIVSGTIVLNQIRTLVAHLWANEGEQMSVTAQYLDSVNVPPPGILPALWAPVGLRYHALHHLLPTLPYHALGEAHRRLSTALGQNSAYHRASYSGGLSGLVSDLVASSIRHAR